MREEIQMKNAVEVISGYTGAVPLQQHLANFYRNNKNLGSTDRRILSELVYGYFRTKGNKVILSNNDPANFTPELQRAVQEMIIWASKKNLILEGFYNYWSEKYSISDHQQSEFSEYFPLAEKVSKEIDPNAFYRYLKNKPFIFIRIKKGNESEVKKELEIKNWEFRETDDIISFSKHYPLDTLESFENGYFEIQDIASQYVAELFKPKKNQSWWDCCAGSGGKSLLLLEMQPQIQLFVSDTRPSIIQNLHERFERNGYENYNSYVIDLEKASDKELNKLPQFNNIIADVPCSGSGTWGRTPEWLSYFTEDLLSGYINKQRKIISTVTNKLLPGGKIIYITCSVYADENEKNIEWFEKHLKLKCEQQKYFQFSKEGGDTLFGAVLTM
ncbi:MAG: hypothetical protein ACHQFW_10075 [Chitinophagales bacterium]